MGNIRSFTSPSLRSGLKVQDDRMRMIPGGLRTRLGDGGHNELWPYEFKYRAAPRGRPFLVAARFIAPSFRRGGSPHPPSFLPRRVLNPPGTDLDILPWPCRLIDVNSEGEAAMKSVLAVLLVVVVADAQPPDTTWTGTWSRPTARVICNGVGRLAASTMTVRKRLS